MFNTQEHFSIINTVPFIKVSTGDASSSLLAEGKGTVNIICIGTPLTLKNCLFVPSLTGTLVSLLELFKDKLTIAREEKCFSLESSKIPALKGTIQKKLMILNYTVPKALITKSPRNIWHHHLGHPGSIPLKTMGLPYTLDQCTTCDFNKAHALPFIHQFDPFVIAKKAMENLHDRSLKRLVSDRCGEFMNKAIAQSLKKPNVCLAHLSSPINTGLKQSTPQLFFATSSPHHQDTIFLPMKVVVAKNVVFGEDVFPSLGNPTHVPEPLLIPFTEGTVAVDEVGSVESLAVGDIPPVQLPEAPHSPLCPTNAGSIPQSEDEESLVGKPPSGPPRRIKVIGPQHPTLISCDLDGSNVLPYSRPPKAFVSSCDDTPRTHQGAIKSSMSG
ncbi:hypothetical protein O181_068655 [Austropuccinia psidii MF-1]|uniref:Retrovirus-related Pol polyprotein from transposon TNT 1-94-like beta-barrel domain-containing protein n=1 Tax=Austropuccinia psidii MF-1 TaxID=1389203 RepID=A0A9Q3I798_9BASI|nr:hypothetical protein [Austropuccinia psidii MF-1]